MSEIRWLGEALEDIDRLHRFLLQKHPDAAKRAVRAIMDGATLLLSSPRLGRPLGDGTGRRELFLNFGSGAYILRYGLENENTIVILRVWHSREERDG